MWVLKLLSGIIVFGCILFLTYITTKVIGERTSAKMKNRHMKIIESMSLGVDKYIHLVHAGNKYFLIAASGKVIQYLTDIQIDEDTMTHGMEDEPKDFSIIFSKYINEKEDRQILPHDTSVNDNITRIKASFQKLKMKEKEKRGGDESKDE